MSVSFTHGCSSSKSSSSRVFMMSVAVGEDRSASWTHILLSMAKRGGQLVAHTHLNASANTFHCARMCMLHSFLVFKATATSWTDITYEAKDLLMSVPRKESSGGEMRRTRHVWSVGCSRLPECSALAVEEAGAQTATWDRRTDLQELSVVSPKPPSASETMCYWPESLLCESPAPNTQTR